MFLEAVVRMRYGISTLHIFRNKLVRRRDSARQNSTISPFRCIFFRIKVLVDALASIGDLVPLNQYINIILEGLTQYYSPVISVIESRFGTMDLQEVEALLLVHETRLN